jgi:hypothetical protein
VLKYGYLKKKFLASVTYPLTWEWESQSNNVIKEVVTTEEE